MHNAKVPNHNVRPSYLLRKTYRDDGKVKNGTPANLSKLPVERIETLRAALRGAAEIGRAVGAVLSKRKMAKHFERKRCSGARL